MRQAADKKVARRTSIDMAVALMQAESIAKAVEAISACTSCDVFMCEKRSQGGVGCMSPGQGLAWVRECRLASQQIRPRHKKEFIYEVLREVYNCAEKCFGVVTMNERQGCLKCFRNAYGFDDSVFSAAKKAVERGEPQEMHDVEKEKCDGTRQYKESQAVNWCRAKYKENMDHGQNRDPVGGNIMVDKPDRVDWYSEFVMDEEATGVSKDKIAAPRTFYRAMRTAMESFKNPSIMHRKHLPFARCAQCHAISRPNYE